MQPQHGTLVVEDLHMTYRMLIGRQAIRSDMLVDCATSFRQPKLSYQLYAGF